jgi:NAD-dependent dihydropyrimidine dehydrogenase PreA subunit
MFSRSGVNVLIVSLLLIAALVLLSALSMRLWGMKPETTAVSAQITIRPDLTVAQFAEENHLPKEVLKEALGLRQESDLQRKLEELGIPHAEIEQRARKAASMSAEYGSKNWVKIPVKLAFWAALLAVMFRVMRRGGIAPAARKWYYLSSVVLFGVILGPEPSPMGTIKDTIALFGSRGIIFPPRAIVLSTFLLIVIVANKFICAWGCQFGTLQDLLFRIDRDRDERSILPQFKLPFAATNAVRVVFFLLFTVLAFGWATDIIAPIDPFRIYNPLALTLAGAVVLGTVLIASLFVYRPWCHLLCPFGFIGWLAEKASVFKIQVNYETCIACGQCSTACPSTVMEAVLKRERTIPDCFACGTCVNMCPTRSIAFRSGKRESPPPGKFA